MKLDNLSDEELVSNINNKKLLEESYALLYKRHKHNLINFLKSYSLTKEEKEDVIQDSYLKLALNIEKYTPKKVRFTTWLYTIVKNSAIDNIRKKKVYGKDLVNKSFDLQENEFFIGKRKERLPDEILYKKEFHSKLNSFIEKLPETQKDVIKLRFKKEYSYKEIVEARKMKMGSVKSNIHKGKSNLRKRILKEFGNDFH